MMGMNSARKSLTVLAGAAALAAAGTSIATAADGDAQITVGPQTTLKAGAKAPFDAAGVRAIRRGQAIPKGYTLVGRKITIDRGTAGSAGAVAKISCPAGTVAKTMGLTGKVGPNPIGDYVGHKDVRFAAWSPPLSPVASGVSYAVCHA